MKYCRFQLNDQAHYGLVEAVAGVEQITRLLLSPPEDASGSLEDRLNNWINLNAFSAAPAFTFGNAPRTLPNLRTPGQRNVDLSVQKLQAIGGRSISVRADVLNLFDNPLFTTLQSQFGTPTFGQLTAVGGYARSVQFQVRFGW